MAETTESVKQRRLHCICGNEVETTLKVNTAMDVRLVRDQTGWFPVFVDEPDCLTFWHCPTCQHKIIEKARELTNLLQTPFVNLSNLISSKEVDEWREKARRR